MDTKHSSCRQFSTRGAVESVVSVQEAYMEVCVGSGVGSDAGCMTNSVALEVRGLWPTHVCARQTSSCRASPGYCIDNFDA